MGARNQCSIWNRYTSTRSVHHHHARRLAAARLHGHRSRIWARRSRPRPHGCCLPTRALRSHCSASHADAALAHTALRAQFQTTAWLRPSTTLPPHRSHLTAAIDASDNLLAADCRGWLPFALAGSSHLQRRAAACHGGPQRHQLPHRRSPVHHASHRPTRPPQRRPTATHHPLGLSTSPRDGPLQSLRRRLHRARCPALEPEPFALSVARW